MSIVELTKKMQESAEQRTHAERMELLKEANILDKDGYYCEEFFSRQTVEQDKKARK